MTAIWRQVSQWLGLASGATDPLDQEKQDALRRAFQTKSLHFKRLLQANTKALHAMATLEESLEGSRPYTMQSVRALGVDICANVFTMVRSLQEMAPARYDALTTAFKSIQQAVEAELAERLDLPPGPLVMDMRDIGLEHALETGGKMASLAAAARDVQACIPRGFVVTASAFRRFLDASGLQEEIDRQIQVADAQQLDALHALSSAIQQRIIATPLPEALAEAIAQAHARLREEAGPEVKVAVRSSALSEDAHGASFAGQYRSDLNVQGEDLLDHYKEVVASKYGVTAMAYRQAKGIRDEDVAMCVGCLEMVDAVAGGVAYSMNPLAAGDATLHIHAVLGLPKAVVDGQTPADSFSLYRDDLEPLETIVARKRQRYVLHPQAGVALEDVPEAEQDQPSLTVEQARRVGRLAMDLERAHGCPQDVEWAFDRQGRLILLQTRPLAVRRREALAEIPAETRREALLLGGKTASGGVAAGPVHVVRQTADALLFPEGGVLVAHQALPRWAPLLRRAAAVVTEGGSPAGHLANVAREFGVPAVVGAEQAVSRLANAGEVTVDADRTLVLAGRREDLLARQVETPINPLVATPLHGVLERVAARIVPLTLIDPAAPTFRPESCRTLHDVTRYCHEQSVNEMFNMGAGLGGGLDGDDAFPLGMSKQLHCGRPMQYWVVDLGEGFRKEIRGKHVPLEEIACVPMLAWWQGMVAIPWDGPPAVDAKGFMSVMAEAAANPELEAGAQSSFTMRNYFIISKYFMSLQSRLGFHFCTVEAMAGPEAEENSLLFSFKGGAASLDRRQSRARLVADLLAEEGFQVELRGDVLSARLEGLEQHRMEIGLRQVGYLMLHTRQVDMIMGDPAKAQAMRHRLRQGLAQVAGLGGD